jgi:hypothetical protein
MNKGFTAVIISGIFAAIAWFMRKYIGIVIILLTIFVGLAWFKGDVIDYQVRQEHREDAKQKRIEQDIKERQQQLIEDRKRKEEQARLQRESDERVAAIVERTRLKVEQLAAAREEKQRKEEKRIADEKERIELQERIKQERIAAEKEKQERIADETKTASLEECNFSKSLSHESPIDRYYKGFAFVNGVISVERSQITKVALDVRTNPNNPSVSYDIKEEITNLLMKYKCHGTGAITVKYSFRYGY